MSKKSKKNCVATTTDQMVSKIETTFGIKIKERIGSIIYLDISTFPKEFFGDNIINEGEYSNLDECLNIHEMDSCLLDVFCSVAPDKTDANSSRVYFGYRTKKDNGIIEDIPVRIEYVQNDDDKVVESMYGKSKYPPFQEILLKLFMRAAVLCGVAVAKFYTSDEYTKTGNCITIEGDFFSEESMIAELLDMADFMLNRESPSIFCRVHNMRYNNAVVEGYVRDIMVPNSTTHGSDDFGIFVKEMKRIYGPCVKTA